MGNINKSRTSWIDIARFIGICMVVLGHTNLVGGIVLKWIFTFHMPLFFVISGFCYRKKSIKCFVIKRLKTLYLPYIVYSMCYLIIDGFIYGFTGLVETFDSILNIVLGNGVLWFLIALLSTELIYLLVDILTTNVIKRVIIVFSLCSVGIILNTLSVSFPYRIHTALMMIPYFEVGRLIKEYGFCCDKYIKNSYLRFMLFFVIDIVITIINENVDVRIGNYNNYLMFFIGGIAGTLTVFEISRLIGKCRLFEIIGQNTLCIYALNAYVPTCLKEIGGIFTSGLIRKIVTLIVLIIAVYISENIHGLKKIEE